jgi:hypothetical protein
VPGGKSEEGRKGCAIYSAGGNLCSLAYYFMEGGGRLWEDRDGRVSATPAEPPSSCILAAKQNACTFPPYYLFSGEDISAGWTMPLLDGTA